MCREKVNQIDRRNCEKRFSLGLTEVRDRDRGHHRLSIYFRFDLNTLIFFARWRPHCLHVILLGNLWFLFVMWLSVLVEKRRIMTRNKIKKEF